MANRMIHTPAWTGTSYAQYWTTALSMSVASGWLLRSTGAAYVTKTFDAQTGWTIGFRFKYEAATDNMLVVGLYSGTTPHCDLRLNQSTGILFVTRNGTVLLTSSTALQQGTTYYIEIQFVIHDTTGVAILKVDGVTDSVINSSALDTRNGTPTNANVVQFQGSNASGLFQSHFYINDNSGGVDDTFWGPITVVTMQPSGAGNSASWTPSAGSNYQNVDDATMNGDTDYNATSTNGAVDTFAASDTGYASGTVKGVEAVLQARKTDSSGSVRIAPVFRIGSTDYVGTDQTVPMSFTVLSERFRQSPATASAWTVGELDGLEIGYKRTAA